MIQFEKLSACPYSIKDVVGFIPMMLMADDPRPAREQLDEGYKHGGGWRPMGGFTFDRETLKLKYPGNPAMDAFAKAKLRDETILVFECGFVCIVQADGSFEVARMD